VPPYGGEKLADEKSLDERLKAIQEELQLLRETVFPMLADIRSRLFAQQRGD
jgi:hypothetical protein